MNSSEFFTFTCASWSFLNDFTNQNSVCGVLYSLTYMILTLVLSWMIQGKSLQLSTAKSDSGWLSPELSCRLKTTLQWSDVCGHSLRRSSICTLLFYQFMNHFPRGMNTIFVVESFKIRAMEIRAGLYVKLLTSKRQQRTEGGWEGVWGFLHIFCRHDFFLIIDMKGS